MIIAIDGPIATGKSTIAKALASEIGYIYFDTGAMFRCVTYGLMKHQINLHDSEKLTAFLDTFQFDIKVKNREKRYFVEDEDVSDKIRQESVTLKVSEVSAIAEVRHKLMLVQREWANGVNAVFEGRDMGTVVFPDADCKIFLTGHPETRAKRRFEELKARFPNDTLNLTLEKVLADINYRDHYDMTREISPLKQAGDAFVIDTSTFSIDEIVFKILEYKDTKSTDRT